MQGMTIDSYGELYSTDTENGEVDGYYLGPTGYNYDYTWTGQGNLVCPDGVKIDGNGNLVVADSCYPKIFNLSWINDSILNQTASTGLKTFDDVALNASGNIFVADFFYQIVEYYSNYNYFNSFIGSGWSMPLTTSGSVGFDSQGNLFISDVLNNRVVYATTQGNYLSELDGFNGPTYLVLDNADDLFVVDTGNYRVDEFIRQ